MGAWLAGVVTHPAFLVGLGGALGSNARYWLGLWFRTQPWTTSFHWGTFTINVSGSLLLGIVAVLFRDRAGSGFLLLGTGFCGGYTTFSTFSLEVTEALRAGRWDIAAAYVFSSVAAGFLAFAIAYSMTAAARGE